MTNLHALTLQLAHALCDAAGDAPGDLTAASLLLLAGHFAGDQAMDQERAVELLTIGLATAQAGDPLSRAAQKVEAPLLAALPQTYPLPPAVKALGQALAASLLSTLLRARLALGAPLSSSACRDALAVACSSVLSELQCDPESLLPPLRAASQEPPPTATPATQTQPSPLN